MSPWTDLKVKTTDVGRWRNKSEDLLGEEKIAGDQQETSLRIFLRCSPGRKRSKRSMAADGCLQVEDDSISHWS